MNLLQKLGSWASRHSRLAVVLWLVALVGVSAVASAVGTDYRNDHSLPGTESQRVFDTLERTAPAEAGDTVSVVLQHRDGLTAPAVRERVTAMLGEVGELPHAAAVRSPYEDRFAVAQDGTIGYATVALDGRAEEVPAADIERLVDVAQEAEGGGLRVELGGEAIRAASEGEGGGSAEGAGMLAALAILVVLFGSLLAAALPLITAVFAVGTTIGLVGLASHAATIADYTPPLMMLVGLGVGIDYALLVFARFRSELLAGQARERAVATALSTAGRSVFFAACVVVIALLGLYSLGLGSLQGVALAVALTVLVVMAASLSLLPALLTLFGRRIERSVRKRAARHDRADGERWRRLSRAVQRRPWPALVVALALLLALAAPAADLRLGFADAGNDAPSTTSRQAYDLLAKGFGPGFNGPLLVVAEGDRAATDALAAELERTPGVAAVAPASHREGIGTVLAFPETAPQDEATDQLLSRLRDDVVPALEGRTGAQYLVGGATAASADFSTAVADRLPLFVLVVVGLSALLLAVVFRSVLIPLKAAVLNLVTIGASLGAITLVFQHGWLGAEPGPIEAFNPVMIFAIVFGLSMDYEVFLVSRMQEEWRRHRDAGRAITEGLATTGGVITAAGAIMIVVFAAFLLSPDRMLQQFGLGLAVAILVDAFVIRSLVLPAIMAVLGDRAWWWPASSRARQRSRDTPDTAARADSTGNP